MPVFSYDMSSLLELNKQKILPFSPRLCYFVLKMDGDLGDPAQFHGFKHRLYANEPKFISPAQTASCAPDSFV